MGHLLGGAACKGLHCLGCGKGIPAGVLAVIAVVVAVLNPRPVLDALANFIRAIGPELIGLGACAAFAIVGTMAVIARMRQAAVLDYSRFDGPTMVEQWEEAAGVPLVAPPRQMGPSWPLRPAIAPTPVISGADVLIPAQEYPEYAPRQAGAV